MKGIRSNNISLSGDSKDGAPKSDGTALHSNNRRRYYSVCGGGLTESTVSVEQGRGHAPCGTPFA